MKKNPYYFLFFVILLSSFCYPQKISAEPQKNVILFSVDGTNRDCLLDLLERGRLPNLELLIENGVYLELTQIDSKTQTKNAHAQLLTGSRGDFTGVWDNGHVFHPVPRGETILELIENHFGENNIKTAFITGKYKNIYPAFINLQDLDVISIEDRYLDEGTEDDILNFIDENYMTHFAAFFHTAEPDKQGHIYREGSYEYQDALISVDKTLGKLIDSLTKYGVYDNTLLYITTDHGFMKGNLEHPQEPYTWLITNDLNCVTNEDSPYNDLVDVPASILFSLGIPLPERFDGIPLQLARTKQTDEDRRILFQDDTDPVVDVFVRSITYTEFKIGEIIHLPMNVTDDNKLKQVYFTVHHSEKELYRKYGEVGTVVFSDKLNNSFEEIDLTWNTTGFSEGHYYGLIFVSDESENVNEISFHYIILKGSLPQNTTRINTNTPEPEPESIGLAPPHEIPKPYLNRYPELREPDYELSIDIVSGIIRPDFSNKIIMAFRNEFNREPNSYDELDYLLDLLLIV